MSNGYVTLTVRAAIAGVGLLIPIGCHAQDQSPPPQAEAQDHSCTVDVAYDYRAFPAGRDGGNFTSGQGFQAGGGFAVTRPAEPDRGARLYLTANFMYERLSATGNALAQATAASTALVSATSAHGNFFAATFDPTVRYFINRRTNLYLVGGFGWFRRGVVFNGPSVTTLTQSGAPSLDKLAANSGVFDVGGGVNFGLTQNGGPMIYAGARVYRGLATNSGTTLVPLSVGVRW